MKWGRIAGTVLFLFFLATTVRAIYLHRIWTIARIWAKLPPAMAPHPFAFLSFDAWGGTAHNVYGDVVFFKARGSSDLNAASDTQWRSIPNTDGGKEFDSTKKCGTPDWYRVNPANVAPQDLAPCYGVAAKHGVPGNARAKAIAFENNVGGFIATDTQGYLYLAVYRTR